jgi:hypothetical protein
MVTALKTAPPFRHFIYEREVIIETDPSNYVSAEELSQRHDDGERHPLWYYSKKPSPVECNYDIYDTELMVIIETLDEWRPECKSATYPLHLITDHKTLE